MDDEEEQQKLPDLVKALVHHLLSQNLPPNSPPLNPTSCHFQNSLRYAHRILSSHLTPSVTPDVAAIAESIKRRLATEGRSSEALSFADLYTKFVSKAADVDNKWSLLHLFNIISQDRKTAVKSQLDASVFLPNLTISDNNVGPRRIENKGWSDGVVVLAKDPNNRHDIAFHEYVKLVKEENDVTEEAMVTDVLYACQGVDGKYVKFDNENNCYVLLDSIRVSRGTTGMVYRLCELGVLFKKRAIIPVEDQKPFLHSAYQNHSKGFHIDINMLPKPLTSIDDSSSASDGSKVRVAYQGVPGAYSEDAALKAYPNCETVPCDDYEAAFKAVELWLVDKAVLPIENSADGSIHRNYDLLLQHKLNIVGEVQLRANHCLLGLPGVTMEELVSVVSHPQALAQCRTVLNDLGVDKVRDQDTAVAAKTVAINCVRHTGAIASSRAAEIYGLDILAEGIQDDDENVTRFLVLAREPRIPGTDRPHKDL
ncbi:hypothetical protein KIW84_014749 [Lathyrus oleraceus]|uniref:arogenate dehydratase n=1 Tax=Pisum sativum TaxID=3888 RepID=A0A9D5H006_PEA|nr:hypothetical protein KIW84_014749 [Pisum sativum]